jgi:hypothetical protein
MHFQQRDWETGGKQKLPKARKKLNNEMKAYYSFSLYLLATVKRKQESEDLGRHS